MVSNENSAADMPIPALLVERAIALSRAEAGLALAHARRIAVRAVSALLGTIVACAFAQMTLLLIVAWPVLSSRGQTEHLTLGILASALLAAGGAALAGFAWAGVGRDPPARPKKGHPDAASVASPAVDVGISAERVNP